MSSYFDNISWVAVDLETTGLNPWQNEIIEIGAARFSINGITESYQKLVRPKKKQDPKSRKVHNITNEEIDQKGHELKEALLGLLAFIGEDRLVFHNASFDLSFLITGLKETKLPIPTNYYYDSLYLSKHFFKEREKHSLSHLRTLLNLDSEDEHRALSDAIATAKVFIHILRERGSEVTSRKRFTSFFRYHRRFSEFQIQIPKEMDSINKYFDQLIHQKKMIKIKTLNKETGAYENYLVIPLALMIFNQRIYAKCKIYLTDTERLFPFSDTEFFDPELGKIKF